MWFAIAETTAAAKTSLVVSDPIFPAFRPLFRALVASVPQANRD